MVHTVLRKTFFDKNDPTRDYTVKSTQNWPTFQLLRTPSTRTSLEPSFRAQFIEANRFSISSVANRQNSNISIISDIFDISR
ncbi:Aspartate carbamoyltransferase, partial [Frankliniella fusca]